MVQRQVPKGILKLETWPPTSCLSRFKVIQKANIFEYFRGRKIFIFFNAIYESLQTKFCHTMICARNLLHCMTYGLLIVAWQIKPNPTNLHFQHKFSAILNISNGQIQKHNIGNNFVSTISTALLKNKNQNQKTTTYLNT